MHLRVLYFVSLVRSSLCTLPVGNIWWPSLLPPESSFIASYTPKYTAWAGPAPITTELTPLHNDLNPWVEETLSIAEFKLEYATDDADVGAVCKTCIRVLWTLWALSDLVASENSLLYCRLDTWTRAQIYQRAHQRMRAHPKMQYLAMLHNLAPRWQGWLPRAINFN